jgi:Tfp pilus assembly protein PilV
LIEVLASVVVLLVGITAGVAALSGMSATEVRMRDSEKVNRLATQKLDEILALGNVESADTDGNFEDYNEPNYAWTLEVIPTGTENLTAVRVTVKASTNPEQKAEAEAASLIFVPPTTTGATN